MTGKSSIPSGSARKAGPPAADRFGIGAAVGFLLYVVLLALQSIVDFAEAGERRAAAIEPDDREPGRC
jgi:hypothetical protein